MRSKDKIRRIARILDELYPSPEIPLRHRDPFSLLVATVLSAQCTDVRVNQVAPVLLARARTPGEMARLDLNTIRDIIRPCGLSEAKSKSIQGLSKMLIDQHNGGVPDTFDALEALPGVGHKTASVVMCQAFGKPAFPVDTHIHRLAKRWGLSSGKSVARTEEDLKRLFPADQWAKRHLQIIYFGREYCPARGHVSATCPICSFASTEIDQ